MNKKGSTLLYGLIGIMVAVVLFTVPYDVVQTAGTTTDVVNETFTGLNATAVPLANDDLVSGTMVISAANDTVILADGNYTLNLDYGYVTITDVDLNNTELNATYTYEPTGYIGGTAGTVVGYAPILLVILLIIGIVAYMGLKK